MSEQVDTRALRAHLHELREMHFDIDEGDDSLYVHGGVDGGIYPVEILLRRNKDAIVAMLNAAPALLDEVDGLRAEVREQSAIMADMRSDRYDKVAQLESERDALRARVAELEQLACDWQGASGLERGGDPSTITPADCEQNVQALMNRVAELEREVERVRDSNGRLRDAVRDAIEAAERTLPQSCGRFMVRDVRIGDAQVELWRAALAPRAEVEP